MNRQDVILIHTRFALQHPLQLASVDSRVVLLHQNTFREFTSDFSRMAVLSWSNKFA